jgi:hypothetical protein
LRPECSHALASCHSSCVVGRRLLVLQICFVGLQNERERQVIECATFSDRGRGPDLDVRVEWGVLCPYARVVICLVAHEGSECLCQDDSSAGEEVQQPLRASRHPLSVLVKRSLDVGVLLELMLDRLDDVPLQEAAQLRGELCVCLEEHSAQALGRDRELTILRKGRRVGRMRSATFGIENFCHARGEDHLAKLVLGGLESNLSGGARPSPGRLERRDPRLCPAADALERGGENTGASHGGVMLDIPRGAAAAAAAARAPRAAKVVLAILHSLPCGAVATDEHRRVGGRGGDSAGGSSRR